jgi:predicted nucleotidyltransferase
MVDPAIVEGVRKYLDTLKDQGIPVSFGVLYGSRAAGKSNPWSDIDLLVVSTQFDQTIDRKVINKLWHVAARTDSRIEPIPCGERQWHQDTSCALIEIARKEGISIYTSS